MENSEQSGRGSSSFLRTCFNGANVLIGVGILSVPVAISEGGWLSLMFLVVVAVVCWYTGLLLKRCMDSDPVIRNYHDIGERALGYKGRALVTFFMNVEMYLFAVELLILEGDNLNRLFPNVEFNIWGLKIGGKQGFVMLTTLVILPTTWLRSLGMLAYVSASGFMAMILLVGCVLWAGVFDGVGFHHGNHVLLKWKGVSTTISMFAFCYSGHACFPTLYHSMTHKPNFSKVLLVIFVTSTSIYGSMAVIGNLMYGQHLKPQITLNLPLKKLSAQIAIYTTVLAPVTKYAIIMTPTFEAIETKFQLGNKTSLTILLRTVIVISTLVVALTFPFFGYVMAFIGAFLSINGSILLPCIFYLKINKAARCLGLEVVLIIGIMIVGGVFSILGTYTSVRLIISHL
ncbi:Transmembrane amino acid transporter family protein [Euphorbia peplus]|nr:Transmembrane amino acid transporter family protein [Euphorbia peplus]